MEMKFINRSYRRTFSAGLGVLALVLAGCHRTGPEPAPPVSEESAPAPANEPAAPAPAPETPAPAPWVTSEPFGEHAGKLVKRHTLKNQHGLVLKVIDYGAIITELHVPDRDGKLGDVVLGRDSLADYVESSPYFGATIGRVANRIKGARFELEGKTYVLANNDGPNHLHGGKVGWDKVVWSAETKETESGPQVIFTYTSPDGEEGYPGTVQATTVYTLTHDNELRVEMRATSDRTTLINMAHHGYWNLGGHESGTIRDHELTLFAEKYTPAPNLVPNGEVKQVQGTAFDFRTPKLIGLDLEKVKGTPIGFDHNWIISGEAHTLRPVAVLKHPGSGRVMELSANQPGVQFYSGNFLDGTLKGKGGIAYPQYSGLCLESQKFPNSVNVPAWRDEVILRSGQTYEHVMVHRFRAE